jgi:1-acyl-sn-glycerol-3-phosphate acyltransferase
MSGDGKSDISWTKKTKILIDNQPLLAGIEKAFLLAAPLLTWLDGLYLCWLLFRLVLLALMVCH